MLSPRLPIRADASTLDSSPRAPRLSAQQRGLPPARLLVVLATQVQIRARVYLREVGGRDEPTQAPEPQGANSAVAVGKTYCKRRRVLPRGGSLSCVLEHPVVLVMRADPEPNHVIPVPYTQHPVIDVDADGINRPPLANSLELQTGMAWILREQPVRFACLPLDLLWQSPVCLPEAWLCERPHATGRRDQGAEYVLHAAPPALRLRTAPAGSRTPGEQRAQPTVAPNSTLRV